jgi:methyl-accepting chemotaxis protein
VSTCTDPAKGEGDRTTRLPVSTRDEIGQLAGRFNEFMAKQHGMIKAISKAVKTFSCSSTQLQSLKDCSLYLFIKADQ